MVLTVRGDLDASRLLSTPRFSGRVERPDLVPSALDFLPAALGLLLIVELSLPSGAMKVPGPTDFLGALAGGLLLKAFGGN